MPSLLSRPAAAGSATTAARQPSNTFSLLARGLTGQEPGGTADSLGRVRSVFGDLGARIGAMREANVGEKERIEASILKRGMERKQRDDAELRQLRSELVPSLAPVGEVERTTRGLVPLAPEFGQPALAADEAEEMAVGLRPGVPGGGIGVAQAILDAEQATLGELAEDARFGDVGAADTLKERVIGSQAVTNRAIGIARQSEVPGVTPAAAPSVESIAVRADQVERHGDTLADDEREREDERQGQSVSM